MEKMKKTKKHRKNKKTKKTIFEDSWQLLYMLLFAVAAAMCALQFAIYCHDQAARLVKPFAAPCQLLNCLRMIGTPASSPFLCKLSVVGITLLRCTSVTIMAMERGNADRMEVDTGAAIPEEYLG